MRVEPHTVGSVLHVVKRGSRGLSITRDDFDCLRFLRLLYYANDTYHDPYWEENTKENGLFGRLDSWPLQQPLVEILAWALMPNHFHLVVKEIEDGGTAKFMQKLCGSMTTHFNKKYKETGSLFQGAYRGKTADLHGDSYLRLLAVYVMVKNPLECYPGGLEKAILDFDNAYDWVLEQPFSSLGRFIRQDLAPVASPGIFGEIFEDFKQFRIFSKETLLYKLEQLQFERRV